MSNRKEYVAVYEGVIRGAGSTIDRAREDAEEYFNQDDLNGFEVPWRFIAISLEEADMISKHGWNSDDDHQHRITQRTPEYIDNLGPCHNPYRLGDDEDTVDPAHEVAGF